MARSASNSTPDPAAGGPPASRDGTGGQAGLRGYLAQTLVAILDVIAEEEFDAITLEPTTVSSKFDILWESAGELHAIQVKSTKGQFGKTEIEKWCRELQKAAQTKAENPSDIKAGGREPRAPMPVATCTLCLVGQISHSVTSTSCGTVRLKYRDLHAGEFEEQALKNLREQAAQRLGKFLDSQKLHSSSRNHEYLVDQLTVKLEYLSVVAGRISKQELITLLRGWSEDCGFVAQQGALAQLTDEQMIRKIIETQNLALDEEDQSSDWRDQHFTPLEALVENQNGRGKVGDLATALSSLARSRSVLILGDPGSGKSVALRHYCRMELLEGRKAKARAPKSFPVYVNLRDFQPPGDWRGGALPEASVIADALRSFIFKRISSLLPLHLRETSQAQLQSIHLSERILLVLDSFDELPPLLDADERDVRLKLFSRALERLFSQNSYRGVLASRHYRRPVRPFAAAVTLVVKPLDDARLFTLLRTRCKDLSLERLEALFRDRPDLVAVARNPFVSTLLVSFLNHAAEHGGGGFPANQAEIFSAFIQNHLTHACMQSLPHVDPRQIREVAEALGRQVFESSNLEIKISGLPQELRGGDSASLIDAMVRLRFLRRGAETLGTISFAHRRFAEYFAACDSISRGQELPTDSIPADSKWREALVLYCQLVPEAQARAVAEECWRKLRPLFDLRPSSGSDEGYVMHLYLRFLMEAFQHRSVLRADEQADLARYLETSLNRKIKGKVFDLLLAKRNVEAIPLCSQADMSELLAKALAWDDSWIRETALRTCRYAVIENPLLLSEVMKYVSRLTGRQIFKQRHELAILLGLSKATSGVLNYIHLRLIELWCRRVAAFLALATPLWVLASWRENLLHQVWGESPQFALMLPGLGLWYLVSGLLPSQSRPKAFQRNFISVAPFFFAGMIAFSWWKLPFSTSVADKWAREGLREEDVIALMVIGLLSFPFTAFHGYWQATRVWWPLIWLKKWRFLAGGIGLACLGGLMDSKTSQAVWSVAVYPVTALIVLALGLTGLGCVVYPFYLIHVFWCHRRLKRECSLKMTREKIAGHMARLRRSQMGRWLYVRYLAGETRRVTGDWPGGCQPYYPGEKCSAQLGQLDEQWREDERRSRTGSIP